MVFLHYTADNNHWGKMEIICLKCIFQFAWDVLFSPIVLVLVSFWLGLACAKPLASLRAAHGIKRCTPRTDFEERPVHFPEVLRNFLNEDIEQEKGIWFNLTLQSLFADVTQNIEAERFIVRIITKELNEVFQKVLSRQSLGGYVIRKIALKHLDFGCHFPAITNFVVTDSDVTEDCTIQALAMKADVSYAGGLEACVDVELALLSVRKAVINLNKINGVLNMNFSKTPSRQWTISFDENLDIDVSVHVNGAQWPYLERHIINQIRNNLTKSNTFETSVILHKILEKKRIESSSSVDE